MEKERDNFSKSLYSAVIPERTAPEDIQALTRPVSEAIREGNECGEAC
jgi:hypothetical protein